MALCDCIERQIEECRLVKDAKKDLQVIKVNTMKLQQNLVRFLTNKIENPIVTILFTIQVDNLRDLNHKFELYKKIYKTMLSYRDETKLLVKKLSQFSDDLTWTLPLTNNLHSKEIETFKEFPLEYNRRINMRCCYVAVR